MYMRSKGPPRKHRPRIRRLATAYSFISYSQHDWPVVSRLVESLKHVGVWVDKRNVELGDALPDKIESGISGASTFILVLSKSSLASRWVKYETHMATIRHLEDSNFRVLVLKVDDCDVPLRFKPYLYADLTKDSGALQSVVEAASSNAGTVELFRRHFVNRSAELGDIESFVASGDNSIICLHGFYGIGKRTLAEESIRRIWQAPKIAPTELSSAHTGARLTAGLCALASLPLPPDGSPLDELRRLCLLAVETIAHQNRVLIFDHLEHLLDDASRPHPDIAAVIDHLAKLPGSKRIPCFVLSRRIPRFSVATTPLVGYVRVGGMDSKHMATILDEEASRVSRKHVEDRKALQELADHLYGYPLAGRLAAPLMLKYSAEYLLANLSHITSLRRDIAEAILANAVFSEDQSHLLHALAICDAALTVEDLATIAKRPADSIVEDVNVLADYNLLEPEGAAVRLHPLVSDYYWKQARSAPKFKSLVTSIADYGRLIVEKHKGDASILVNWIATACRALFLSDRADEARALRRDFIGELKVAAIELYQRGEYEISLRYCEAYLSENPDDFETSFHLARNLSRVGRSDESLAIIDKLLSNSTSRVRLTRLHFAKGRTFLEMRQLDSAQRSFLKALSYTNDFPPALQGITEVLMREGKIDDAAGFVDRALEASPMDSFALSTKAEILWRRGEYATAIKIMELVVRMLPNNATFLFRLGRFYHQSGRALEAYEFFKRAKASDSSFLDARLSLASTAIDLGNLDEAKREIDSLRNKGPADKRHVLIGIEAQYYLAMGQLETAAEFAEKALSFQRSVVSLGMMAKVEAAKAREAVVDGLAVVAESHRGRALQLIEEGLKLEAENPALKRQRDRLLSEDDDLA